MTARDPRTWEESIIARDQSSFFGPQLLQQQDMQLIPHTGQDDPQGQFEIGLGCVLDGTAPRLKNDHAPSEM